MPCNSYVVFNKVEHYGKPDITRNIEVNLKHYFDWAFLKIGAWQNVDASSSGVNGGNFYRLRPTEDLGYSDGLVYESIRKDWVYETGVDYEAWPLDIATINYNGQNSKNQVFVESYHNFTSGDNVNIINNSVYNGRYEVIGISGNQSFYIDLAANSGIGLDGQVNGIYNPIDPIIYSGGVPYNDSAYSINYPLGRVTFNTNQSSVNVSADYSYRSVQTYLPDDVPWFYEIQFDSYSPNDLHWTQNINSGDFSVASQNRIQLPAIVIDSDIEKNQKPYQLGNLTHIVKQNCGLYVIAQTPYERDNIIDILSNQKDVTITLYDETKINQYAVYSLNYDGDRNPNGLIYPDIVNNNLYRYKSIRVDNATVNNVKSITPDLHIGKVTWKIHLVI